MDLLSSQTAQLYNSTQVCTLLRTPHQKEKNFRLIFLTTAIRQFRKQRPVFKGVYASSLFCNRGPRIFQKYRSHLKILGDLKHVSYTGHANARYHPTKPSRWVELVTRICRALV